MKLILLLMTSAFMALLLGVSIGNELDTNPWFITGGVFLAGMFIPHMPGSLMMAIELTELKAELGDYFRQHKREILKLVTQKTVSMEHMTTKSSAKGEWAMSVSSIGSIVQPFQKDFTPEGDPEFKPNLIRNYRHKIDIKYSPDEIEDSWIAFLYDEGLTRVQMPITKYIIDQLLIPKIMEDRENLIIGKGVFVAPTPGTPGPVGTSMDGFLKVIDDGIGSGDINEIALGALTPTNIFDKVEEFTDGISEVYKGVAMNIFMSNKNFVNYHRDKRNTHGQDVAFKQGDTKVDFSMQSVIWLPSMSGTDTIFSTPKDNWIRLIDKINNVARLEIESEDRQIKIFGDWWEGVGFGISEAVWASSPTA